jgi:ketosteroid isomerase-like protein
VRKYSFEKEHGMRKVILKGALLIVVLLMLVPAVSFAQSKPEKEAIQKEVTDQFNHLISALNQKNADADSEYYSKDGFLSAIAGTDYYGSKAAWVDMITKNFSMRERQHIEPLEVRVTALSSDLALMTSEEKAEMQLKSGETIKSKHVFTMLWKREKGGWKILHSHESWLDVDKEKKNK